jgi:hypothetical protein
MRPDLRGALKREERYYNCPTIIARIALDVQDEFSESSIG